MLTSGPVKRKRIDDMPACGYTPGNVAMTISELARKAVRARYAKMTPEERKKAARKAARGYWDRLTPEERSAEMKRRAAKREKAKKRTKS